jgi:hypothetical protein
MKNKSVQETAMDLVVKDSSRVEQFIFLMNERKRQKTTSPYEFWFRWDLQLLKVFSKIRSHIRRYGTLPDY